MLNTSLSPSGNFDLSNWKITLPVDSSGNITGTAVEVTTLTSYTSSYFYTAAADGAMVFRAAVDGATTSGSSYARSELREMSGSARAAWNLTTGGVMTATLEVDAVPTRFDGTMGKVVVGQIHGQDHELVRLYWDNNKVYFANDQSGSGNTENKFYFFNSSGLQPNVSLNEKFSYVIDAKGSTLEVTIYADGDVYKSVTAINSVWQTDSFYFKAGAYLGVNETQGTGYGQTSFYDLRFNHTDTALTPSDLVAAPTQPSVPVQEPAVPAPTSPTPTEGALKKIGSGVTQMETMALTGFTAFSSAASTGGVGVESRTKDAVSSAKATFEGESGTYALKLDYFDENDGAAQFAVKVNGQTVSAWVADKNLGSAVADAKTLTSQELQVVLKTGDTLEIVGVRHDNDLARVDDITLTKAAAAPLPSEAVPVEPAPSEPAPGPVSGDQFVLPITTNSVTGTLSNNYVKGGSANDLMKGLAGRDVLWGHEGSDVMWGGPDHDADAFVFDTGIGRDMDVIMDFNPVDDSIRLENSIFTKLTKTGALSASNFAVDGAKDANDFIIYNQATGDLAYDADGAGVGQATVFAHIYNHAAVTAADFLVI